ncbi:MAG: hypothetical protein H7840_09300 [Alphaproteobacteria bacterium]
MLTCKDCLALMTLDREEELALAVSPPLPEEVVLDLGRYVLLSDEGEPALRQALLFDLEACRRARDIRRMAELKAMVRQFVDHHPSRRAAVR